MEVDTIIGGLTTTVRCNDTLVDTPFQLISGFFHGVLCCELAEQASSRKGGGGNRPAKGGGSNRLPGLVTSQQAVEFPPVLTSIGYTPRARLLNHWATKPEVCNVPAYTMTTQNSKIRFISSIALKPRLITYLST